MVTARRPRLHRRRLAAPRAVKKPFLACGVKCCWGVALASVLGSFCDPHTAIAIKAAGDAFIRLEVSLHGGDGIAGMQDMKKVGRVGGKALLYFEVVSTLALLVGLVVGNIVQRAG